MLGDRNAMATVAVTDIAAAKKFYGGKLGLKEAGDMGEDVVTYRSGGSMLVVYKSEFAGTGKATAATWDAGGEFDAIVRQLREAGVRFEHYEMPGLERQGDVHRAGDFKAAWFKDPDGNILHINNA
jgi:catechol 2,3-dioxygenase-like lactoylglutathione lyase family enzyme